MVLGESKYVNTMFKFIDDESKKDIDEFVLNSLIRSYHKFEDISDVDSVFLANDDLDIDTASYLRQYSGFDFENINAAARGTWNYEQNGNISNMGGYQQLARKLAEIIDKHPSQGGNFVTFRGVSIEYFKDYGIRSLEDLKALEGKFMVDKGFVSTSLLEDRSFFKKENNRGIDYNVKIEFLVPEDFSDGIYIGPMTSINPSECEYLINTSNLSKVTSVTIGEDNTAKLTAVMIPKSIYDDYYKSIDVSQK